MAPRIPTVEGAGAQEGVSIRIGMTLGFDQVHDPVGMLRHMPKENCIFLRFNILGAELLGRCQKTLIFVILGVATRTSYP